MGEIFRKRLIGLLRVGIVVSVVVIGALLGWLVWRREAGWINPLGSGKTRGGRSGVRMVGFLPTWMVGKTRMYCDEIDEMIFLGIEVSEKGELIWDLQAKKIGSEEYMKLKGKLDGCGGRNIVGIKLFDDKKLRKLLADEEGRRKLVDQVKAVIETGKFDGVNVDFEFQNDPLRVLGGDFYQLVKEMGAAGMGSVSVDVFANTIIKGEVADIERLLAELDYLVVMAYDFYRPGSQYVGPVAPIRSPVGQRNITEIVDKVISFGLNKKKMVLAYPLYGYEWKTETDEFGSRAEVYMGMWSYARTSGAAFVPPWRNKGEPKWDETSMTPWVSFKEDETVNWNERVKVEGKWKTVKKSRVETKTHQIYFENEKSLRAKIELAGQAQFGGVGFWALGYEGVENEVWKVAY